MRTYWIFFFAGVLTSVAGVANLIRHGDWWVLVCGVALLTIASWAWKVQREVRG